MGTSPLTQSRPSRGFTLIEVMVSLFVLGVAMAGTISFMVQARKMYAYDGGRILVMQDMRKFTTRLAEDTVYSNYFRIYPAFAQSRTTTQTVSGVTTTVDAALRDGNAGDFLVLAFADTNATTGKSLVNRLVGYYRDPSGTGIGKVRRFDVSFAGVLISATTNTTKTPKEYTFPDLLDAYQPTSSASSNPVVIDNVQGLSSNSLFYNYYDRSVMIRGQISEDAGLQKKAFSTYNFTVSPRG